MYKINNATYGGIVHKCKKCAKPINLDLDEYKVCTSCFDALSDTDKNLLSLLQRRPNRPSLSMLRKFTEYVEIEHKLSIERIEFDIKYFSKATFWFYEQGQQHHLSFLVNFYANHGSEVDYLIKSLEFQRLQSTPNERQAADFIEVLLKEFGFPNNYNSHKLAFDIELVREWKEQCNFWDLDIVSQDITILAWTSKREFEIFLKNVFKVKRDIFLMSESKYRELSTEIRDSVEIFSKNFLEDVNFEGPTNGYITNFINYFESLAISRNSFLKQFSDNAVVVFRDQLKTPPTRLNIMKLIVVDTKPDIKMTMVMRPSEKRLESRKSFKSIPVLPQSSSLPREIEPYVTKGYVSRSWKNRWRKD